MKFRSSERLKRELSNSSKTREKIEHVTILKAEHIIIRLIDIYIYIYDNDLMIETLINYLQRMLFKLKFLSFKDSL